MEITKNETSVILEILKSPEKEYNANNLSRVIKITPMGTLKILRRLKKEDILTSRKIGNASIYNLNFNKKYTEDYVEFLLKREAEQSKPYIKRWINEIRKIDNIDIAILFGSVLKKQEKAKDIDVLLVIKQENFNDIKKKIEKINEINEKNIHPIYQTIDDLKSNIIKKDKIILNAIKGLIIIGEKKFVSLIKSIK